MATTSLWQEWQLPLRQYQRRLRIDRHNAITMRVTIPAWQQAIRVTMLARWWWRHLRINNSNQSIPTMAKMPASINMLTMVPIAQPYSQDACEIDPVRLLLWGGQKVDLESTEWRSIDLHSINSTLTLFWGFIPLNHPSLLSPPPQTVHISWLLPWMEGTALESVLHVAGCPLPSRCCCPIVVV